MRSAPCLMTPWPLVDRDAYGLGGDAVRHYHQRTGSGLHIRGDVKVGRNRSLAGGNSHGAVVVRPGIENVMAALIRDPHDRVIGRAFKLVPKRRSLRQAV